jgi:hypothetical protein
MIKMTPAQRLRSRVGGHLVMVFVCSILLAVTIPIILANTFTPPNMYIDSDWPLSLLYIANAVVIIGTLWLSRHKQTLPKKAQQQINSLRQMLAIALGLIVVFAVINGFTNLFGSRPALAATKKGEALFVWIQVSILLYSARSLWRASK